MPPGEGGSTHGNSVDGDVRRRPRRRLLWRRSTEKIHPANLVFDLKVAAFQARQQELQNQMDAAILGSLSFTVCFPHSKISEDGHVEDEEERTWTGVFDLRGTSPPLLLEDSTQNGEGQLLKDSVKPPDDTDFLEGTFIKINSDKQKAAIKNKKSSKKQKKKKGKGKGRKEFHASQMQSEPPTEPSSTCAAVTGAETLASSSTRVAVGIPLLEYSSSSSSSQVSQVTEKHIITNTPAVNSASSGNEKELSASSSNDDFKSSKSTTSYATAASSVNDYETGGNAWNSTMGDYAGSLSDAISERSLSASDSTDSRGVKKTSGEGNKPHVHQSFSLAMGPGCSQEALLYTDYASNDGDFQKVVCKKSAQKMKRIQRLLGSPL